MLPLDTGSSVESMAERVERLEEMLESRSPLDLDRVEGVRFEVSRAIEVARSRSLGGIVSSLSWIHRYGIEHDIVACRFILEDILESREHYDRPYALPLALYIARARIYLERES